ncbi:hypothetical protein FGO68_gene4050 [Halteria grandinella]|uniref:Uncharacterized protein n=1 Tax=Halteria grandinella TaxID=5974 RepID=A0A8J8NRK4_HALGN|nr:hypothetical protein FGO68_gene4050 [Halteria grandinella]
MPTILHGCTNASGSRVPLSIKAGTSISKTINGLRSKGPWMIRICSQERAKKAMKMEGNMQDHSRKEGGMAKEQRCTQMDRLLKASG